MKFKFLPHTADVKFQSFGKTLEEAFENAAYALTDTITKGIKVKGRINKRFEIYQNLGIFIIILLLQ